MKICQNVAQTKNGMQTVANKPNCTTLFPMNNITTPKGWGIKELTYVTKENSVLSGYSKAKDQKNCTQTLYVS